MRPALAALVLFLSACITVEETPEPVPMADVGVHACTQCAPWLATQSCCAPGQEKCSRCGLATAPNPEGKPMCCNTAVVRCTRCGRRMSVLDCCGR